MGDAVPFDEEPRQFQEENEEQCYDVFLLGSQLVGLDDKSPNDGQDTPYENEETEEFEEEIKKGPDGARFKCMGKGESRDAMTPFHKITRGEPLDHVTVCGYKKTSRVWQATDRKTAHRVSGKITSVTGTEASESPPKLPA
jgi:hypothetical protein